MHPSRLGRSTRVLQDAARYCLRQKIEDMFARLKTYAGSRRGMSDDQCPIQFLFACALDATIIHWLKI